MTDATTAHGPAADAGHQARRDAEVRHLVAGLEAELAEWTRAGADGGALEKHQSQIESAARVVSGALERLTGLTPAERRESAPELVLDLHHLWDFFRTKLLVRHLPHQRRFLAVADELAWALYDPVRRSAAAHLALREPPLTFLDRHPVPFAAARGSAFEELLPSGAQRTLAGRRASAHLPFPVIGIPWSASHHLPSVLAVAHETGHHIEDDFALTAALGTRLRERAGLPAGRLAQWQDWAGEVFADLCATLACGEAYVRALEDALAAQPMAGDGTAGYPPRAVRVSVCRAALEAGPAAPSGRGDGAEAHAVVEALIGEGFEELGGACLRSLLGLRRPAELTEASARLAAGLRSKRSDVPGVLAAATLAFVADPDRYDRQNVGERALTEVLALVPRGRRAATATGPQLAARDHAAGHDLFALLRAAHRPAAD